MQPRIDTNLGIQSEPDAWMHSACILCSNGCGLEMAVVGRGGDGGRYGPARGSVRAVPLRPRRAVSQPAHLVRARPDQPSAAAQILARCGPAAQLRAAGAVAAGAACGAEWGIHGAVRRPRIRRHRQPSRFNRNVPNERVNDCENCNGKDIQSRRSRKLEFRSRPGQRPDRARCTRAMWTTRVTCITRREDDPQYEIKSDKTDHIALHKSGGHCGMLRR